MEKDSIQDALPDIIIPVVDRPAWTGEQKMMYAILENSLFAYSRICKLRNVRARRLREEDERWFSSNDRHWPFSFINICETLEIDPNYIRRFLPQLVTMRLTKYNSNSGRHTKVRSNYDQAA